MRLPNPASIDSGIVTNPLPLSADEQAIFAALETVIASGIKTFVAVGQALATIREQQLYRMEASRFETYCAERWNLSAAQTTRLIESAQLAAALARAGEPQPVTEAQVRPLLDVPDRAAQQAVWRQALATAPNGRMSAKHVQAAVQSFLASHTPASTDEPVPLASSESRPDPTPEAPAPAKGNKRRMTAAPQRLRPTILTVGAHTVLVHGPEAPALAALIADLLASAEQSQSANGNGADHASNGGTHAL